MNQGDSTGTAFKEALHYWEPRRIGYNLVLTGIAVVWVVFTWPHFRPALTLRHGLQLLVLALLANVCYCAAYPVDLALQATALRSAWLRWRWLLWCAGMLLAVLLANYWIADEIYPDVS